MKEKLIIGLLLITFGGQAYAAKAVFDRSNFAKNTITAAQEVKQTAAIISTNAYEIKQFMLALQNVKQLDIATIKNAVNRGIIPVGGNYQTVNAVLDAAQGVYRTVREAQGNTEKMLQVYQEVSKVNDELARVSNQSGVSIPRILNYEAQQIAAGKMANSELERLNDLNKELQYHQKRSDALVQQLPAANGSLQALQTLGLQNHLMSDQLSQIIQTSNSNAVAAQNEALLKSEERKRSAEIARQAEERNARIYEADKK